MAERDLRDADIYIAVLSLTKIVSLSEADFDTSQMDPLFKKRLDIYW